MIGELTTQYFDRFFFGPKLELYAPSDYSDTASAPVDENTTSYLRATLSLFLSDNARFSLDDVLDANIPEKPAGNRISLEDALKDDFPEKPTLDRTLSQVLAGRVHTGYVVKRNSQENFTVTSTEFALWDWFRKRLGQSSTSLEARAGSDYRNPFTREIFVSTDRINLEERTPSVVINRNVFLKTAVNIVLTDAPIPDKDIKKIARTLYEYTFGVKPAEMTSMVEDGNFVVRAYNSSEGDLDDETMRLTQAKDGLRVSFHFPDGHTIQPDFAENIRNEVTRQRALQRDALNQLALDLSGSSFWRYPRHEKALAHYRTLGPRHHANLHGVFPTLRSRIALRAT